MINLSQEEAEDEVITSRFLIMKLANITVHGLCWLEQTGVPRDKLNKDERHNWREKPRLPNLHDDKPFFTLYGTVHFQKRHQGGGGVLFIRLKGMMSLFSFDRSLRKATYPRSPPSESKKSSELGMRSLSKLIKKPTKLMQRVSSLEQEALCSNLQLPRAAYL